MALEEILEILVNCLFIMAIQEFDCTKNFLEVGVKGLGGRVYWFFLATMHVMDKTVANSNRASGRGNMIEKVVANFVESIRLVRSIIIFDILGFFHCAGPIILEVSILKDLGLVV